MVGVDALLTGRGGLWRGLLQMISDHPLFGMGKDLPFAQYGILIIEHASSGQIAQTDSGVVLGANDSGFSLTARYGIPFTLLLFGTLLRPAFAVKQAKVKSLAHHLAASMVIYWLANGSFQYLYSPDAGFIVIMAAIGAYAFREKAWHLIGTSESPRQLSEYPLPSAHLSGV
jgi:O-antigen ligase